DIMKVKTSGLPPAVVGEPYTFQMECEGGTPPYLWRLTRQCTEEIFQQEMNTPGTYMEPDNWSYGNIPYSLPFSLSLYEKYYDTIYIHPGGFIMFEDTQFPWPYLFDEQLLIRNTACIAPFLCRWLTYAPELGQGIWVHETEDQVSIRWKGDIDNSNYSPVVEFSLLLNANGEITFNYGTEIEARRVNWSCGVSDGNDLDYHFPFIEDQAYINLNYAVKLKTIPLPTNLDLSDDGLLSGIPDNYYQQVDLNFCVEDDDHIRAFKTLEFSATDLGIFDQDNAEGDMIESIFPNPFRLEVTIIFKPEMEGPLSCKVYSSSGQLVSILADKKDTQGSNMLKWYGHDASGKPCPAGIYFIHFQYSGKTHVRKIIYAGP
ncbi:MAG: T9SS type A sorting domain-containing protein, partial [Bacteroidales bacterium]|nr:T9SS type A sorting domain-containing protein [Bacteroidales bacterium]